MKLSAPCGSKVGSLPSSVGAGPAVLPRGALRGACASSAAPIATAGTAARKVRRRMRYSPASPRSAALSASESARKQLARTSFLAALSEPVRLSASIFDAIHPFQSVVHDVDELSVPMPV